MCSLLLLVFSLNVFILKCAVNIWPMPQDIKSISSQATARVAAGFKFTTQVNNDVLKNAIERYTNLIFYRQPEVNTSNSNSLTQLTITITNTNAPLKSGINETYILTVPSTGAGSLSTVTVWGALRGLETFAQMVEYNFTNGYYQAYTGDITDFPRFQHRGLMLDTARHYYGVPGIKRLLEAMSYNKFNVFHWHIVDAEAFPFQSSQWPDLSNKGAYSVYEQYTHNDMIDVVQFAKDRGIRVIIEFDTPGHFGSWCWGYPGICPSASCVAEEQAKNPNNIPLNPAVNITYEVIESLFKEATNLLLDDSMHLGGDEVVYYCWEQTQSIVAWQQKMGFTNAQTYQYYTLRIMDFVASNLNKQSILWQDTFDTFGSALPKSAIIQVWRDAQTLASVVASGLRGILANSNAWYLSDVSVTWQQAYENEPFQYISNVNQQKLVLGGEGCMWGETEELSSLEASMWPRASAIAERLWSNRNINSVSSAQSRLEFWRCQMSRRGIGAAPLGNVVAGQPPPKPGSCYKQ